MNYGEQFLLNDALFTSFVAHIGYIENEGVKSFSVEENGFVSFRTDEQEEFEEIGIKTHNNLGFFVTDFEILDENKKIKPAISREYRKFAAAFFGNDYIAAVAKSHPEEVEQLSLLLQKVEDYKGHFHEPSTHAIIENFDDPNVSTICSAINFFLDSDDDILIDFVKQINPNAKNITVFPEPLTFEYNIYVVEDKLGYANKYTATIFSFRDNFTKQDLTTEWQNYFAELLQPADDAYFEAYDKFMATPRDVDNNINLLTCQIVESKNIAFKVMVIKHIMQLQETMQSTKMDEQ